jgi:hypothetical protein
MSERTFRATLVAVVVLGVFALAAMFLPTEKAGADCGTWPAPEYSDAKMAELAESYAGLDVESMTALGMGADVAALGANARAIATAKAACDDALSTRRNLTFGLLAGVALVPAGVVFVGRTKRD